MLSSSRAPSVFPLPCEDRTEKSSRDGMNRWYSDSPLSFSDVRPPFSASQRRAFRNMSTHSNVGIISVHPSSILADSKVRTSGVCALLHKIKGTRARSGTCHALQDGPDCWRNSPRRRDNRVFRTASPREVRIDTGCPWSVVYGILRVRWAVSS